MLLSTGGPIIFYGLLYALTHIKKAFGKIGEETDLCTLYKMQKFQISLIPVLIFGFAMIVAGLFVSAAKINGAFGGAGYAFTEPELVNLVLGPDTSFKFVFGIVLIIVYAVFVFALIYSTRKNKIYWRYFKGRVAPDEKVSGFGGKKKLIRKNPCLSESLGVHYRAAVKPYLAVRFRRTGEGYAVNAEPNYIKYTVLRIVKPVMAFIVALVLLIVYLAIVPARLNQPVRVGKAACVRLGSSHETVEKLLGKPSANSSQYTYYYTWDSVDIDDLENWDDLENAFNSDFKSYEISVHFEEGKYGFVVSSVEFDADYMGLLNSFRDENILKKIEVKSSYLYPQKKPIVVLYKNGSMKIEWGK